MGIPLDPKEPNLIQRNSQDLQTAHDGPRVQSWDAFPLAARAGRIFFGKASKRAIGGGGKTGERLQLPCRGHPTEGWGLVKLLYRLARATRAILCRLSGRFCADCCNKSSCCAAARSIRRRKL